MHKTQFLTLVDDCDFLTAAQRGDLVIFAEDAVPEQMQEIAIEMGNSAGRRAAMYEKGITDLQNWEKKTKKQKRDRLEAADIAISPLPDFS